MRRQPKYQFMVNKTTITTTAKAVEIAAAAAATSKDVKKQQQKQENHCRETTCRQQAESFQVTRIILCIGA